LVEEQWVLPGFGILTSSLDNGKGSFSAILKAMLWPRGIRKYLSIFQFFGRTIELREH